MKKDIWKVKIISKRYEDLFKQFCDKNNIYYRPYPEPFKKNLYMVECPKDKLFDIGYCIAIIERMPIVITN